MTLQLNVLPVHGPIIRQTNWNDRVKQIRMIQFDQPYQDSFYLPLAIGCVMAHCEGDQDFKDYYKFHNATWGRPCTNDLYGICTDADIFGFSLYVWNRTITHAAAKIARKQNPDSIIIFGGPEAPSDAETFLRKYPYVDFIVYGEGEQTFLELTKALREGRDLLEVESIAFLHNGKYFKTSKRKQMDLELVRSPYLTGIFDHIASQTKKYDFICGIETNRGCPYRCSFCYWGGYTNSKIRPFNIEKVKGELEWFASNDIPLLWLLDANFGVLKRDDDIVDFIVDLRKKTGLPRTMYINWAKNSNERIIDISRKLQKNKLTQYTLLSPQSTNPATLEAIDRENISPKHLDKMHAEYIKYNLSTLMELIVPLPEETVDSFTEGLKYAVARRASLRVYPSLFLTNSPMEKDREKYGIVTQEVPVSHDREHMQTDDNQETENLIVATNTMSTNEVIYCRALQWFVITFFNIGTARYVCLFMEKMFGLDIVEWCRWILDKASNKTGEFPLFEDIVEKSNYYNRSQMSGELVCPRDMVPGLKLFGLCTSLDSCLRAKAMYRKSGFYNEVRKAFLLYLQENGKEYDNLMIEELITYQSSRQVHINGPGYDRRHFTYMWNQFFQEVNRIDSDPELRSQNPHIEIHKKPYDSVLMHMPRFSTWHEYVEYAFAASDVPRIYQEVAMTS